MATQDVHFSITQPDITTGTVGWTGTLLAVPVGTSGHPVVHLDGVDLVVPEPISITITSGEATVAMEINGTTWVWMVKSVDSDSNPMLPARFVSVAASASTVEFADLPQIDLATLSPAANPTAAWDAALAALQAEVDALGTGLPTGGTTGQALVKASSTDGDVAWGDVSVSAASTTAKGIVELATNTETTTGTDTARATTPAGVAAAISAAIANLIASAPSTLDTLNELAAALGDDANFASTMTTALAAKAADSAVVHLTGNETVAGTKTFSSAPVVPTPSGSTDAANKGYVDGRQNTYTNSAPGNAVFCYWNSGTSAYRVAGSSTDLTARPTSRTDVACILIGAPAATSDPSWVIAGTDIRLDTA